MEGPAPLFTFYSDQTIPDSTLCSVRFGKADFFNELYVQSISGNTITFEREEDDGSFTSYSSVIVRRPQYQDESITSTTSQKVYENLSVEIVVK